MNNRMVTFLRITTIAYVYALIYSIATPCLAQFSDSVQINAETSVAIGSDSALPLWIISNRYGIYDNQPFNGLVRASIYLPFPDSLAFGVSAGADIVAGVGSESSQFLLQQGFLKLKYHWLELWGGRVEHTLGTHIEDLSTGSFAISRNARPFPMVQLRVDEYTPVPFTKEYVHFKGNFGHAWFESDRFITNPYLHVKSLYLKMGGRLPVNLYLGFNHLALWGGTHPTEGELPASGSDYLRILQGKGAEGSNLSGENNNSLGDHFGNGEYGLHVTFSSLTLSVYTQTPYEDGTGLEYIISNKDRLLGLHVKREQPGWITEVLYEYVHTKYQSGPGLPDPFEGDSRSDLEPNYGYSYSGRDDYYNNSIYRSGWTYLGRIVGTPLFMTEQKAQRHLQNVNKFNQDIVNNRIVAHHLGIKGYTRKIQYKAVLTYTNNFGTYAGLNGGQKGWLSREPGFEDYQYAFKTPLRQWYSLIETAVWLDQQKSLQLNTAVAFDSGEIYESIGGIVSLKKTIR